MASSSSSRRDATLPAPRPRRSDLRDRQTNSRTTESTERGEVRRLHIRRRRIGVAAGRDPRTSTTIAVLSITTRFPRSHPTRTTTVRTAASRSTDYQQRRASTTGAPIEEVKDPNLTSSSGDPDRAIVASPRRLRMTLAAAAENSTRRRMTATVDVDVRKRMPAGRRRRTGGFRTKDL